MKRHNNIDLYNPAKSPRIDIFILSLDRTFLSSARNSHNTFINNLTIVADNWNKHLETGYIPIYHFTKLHQLEYLQDANIF